MLKKMIVKKEKSYYYQVKPVIKHLNQGLSLILLKLKNIILIFIVNLYFSMLLKLKNQVINLKNLNHLIKKIHFKLLLELNNYQHFKYKFLIN